MSELAKTADRVDAAVDRQMAKRKKATAPVDNQPAPQSATQKANAVASTSMADSIERAAARKADQDAEAIAQFAQGVYDRRLAQNLEHIFGGDLEAYFPSPLAGRALPDPVTASYLPTIEVEALPIAD